MITRLVYVHCDGCGQPSDNAPLAESTASEIEAAARGIGWIRRVRRGRRIHFCPDCKEIRHD